MGNIFFRQIEVVPIQKEKIATMHLWWSPFLVKYKVAISLKPAASWVFSREIYIFLEQLWLTDSWLNCLNQPKKQKKKKLEVF